MLFEDMRIKDVHAVLHYTPNITKWSAKNRKTHFVGIQLSGSARHRFDRKEFVLSRNCVYFFNQRDNYDVEVYERGDAFSVHFTTYEEIETDSFCIPIENPDEMLLLLQKIELLKNSGGKSELALLSCLYRLCDFICRTRHKAYYPKDSRMDAAKSYIDENFKSTDCLRRAVECCGLSSRRFTDLFRERFETTPNRYLTKRRIEQAKHMLETNGLTVGEVAELCGFSDVYYFSKVFKQLCGVSPTKWK